MGNPSKQQITNILIKDYGQFYSEEIGISLHKESPSTLFQWLIASILFSARIRDSIAVEAARSLNKQGWETARRMAQSTWKQRVRALHEAGYSRYQEKNASMLGDPARLLTEKYRGDIRNLRQAAEHRPDGGAPSRSGTATSERMERDGKCRCGHFFSRNAKALERMSTLYRSSSNGICTKTEA